MFDILSNLLLIPPFVFQASSAQPEFRPGIRFDIPEPILFLDFAEPKLRFDVPEPVLFLDIPEPVELPDG
jgi:hypothetical protein